jgi:hypothetical protein
MPRISAQLADAIRRRVEGWRAAEARERRCRREQPVLDPSDAFEAALELSELQPEGAEDELRQREVARASRAWARLRERLPWRRDDRSQV